MGSPRSHNETTPARDRERPTSHDGVREKNENVILTLRKIVKIQPQSAHVCMDNGARAPVWCMQKLVTKCFPSGDCHSRSHSGHLDYIETLPPPPRCWGGTSLCILLQCCNNFALSARTQQPSHSPILLCTVTLQHTSSPVRHQYQDRHPPRASGKSRHSGLNPGSWLRKTCENCVPC